MITTTVVPRAEAPSGRPGTMAAVWGTAVVVLGAGSWTPAWSGDEAATVLVVRRPLSQVLLTIEHDPALVPYYLLVNLWAYPSTAHGWLRLLSVLAMATAVMLTAVLAGRLGGVRMGLFAAALMLALPAVSRYAQDARPYALSVLLVVAVVVCWERGLGSWRARIALTALTAVLGVIQPYGLLIVPVLLATTGLAPHAGRSREFVVTAMSCGAGVLLASPYVWLVAGRAIGQVDPPPVTPRNLIEEALRLPAGLLGPPLAVPLAGLVLMLTAAGIAVGWRRGDRRLAVLVAAWAALPPVLLCLLQVVGGGPGLVARYWTCCLPALALGSAVAVDALWARRRAAGATVLGSVILLALPTQLAIRATDGHQGQRWRDLSVAVDHPALEGAPLLVEGWSYRALVSNDPALADRMRLVIDPASEGRVNPRTSDPGTPAFTQLLREHGRVIVLQDEAGYGESLPTRESFSDFGPELEPYPLLPVRCAYFGEPLGVFTTADGALSADQAEEIARHIAGVAPGRIRCAAGG